MPADVLLLLHRDHEDLDRVLAAMLEPATSAVECVGLLEALRIGFTAHASAHGTVLQRLAEDRESPPHLRVLLAAVLDEHREQSRSLAILATLRPGSAAWTTRALELRVLMLDHASREDSVRAALCDQLDSPTRTLLARDYAGERLRRFGLVEPVRKPIHATPRWVFN